MSEGYRKVTNIRFIAKAHAVGSSPLSGDPEQYALRSLVTRQPHFGMAASRVIIFPLNFTVAPVEAGHQPS